MRDRVAIYLQGGSFDPSYMLPTYEVYEAIEGELAAVPLVLAYHDQRHLTLDHLATIVEFGLKAGEPDQPWGRNAIKKALFTMGVMSDEVREPISELLERLSYTPEQYTAKKTQAQSDQSDLMKQLLGDFSL